VPDQACRYAQMPGCQAKARHLLAYRALGGDSTNTPRVILDTLLAIEHNGAPGQSMVRHRAQLRPMHTYSLSGRPNVGESA
jgi:hypothetical protein